MNINFSNQTDKILVKRYIDGKSFKWLKQYLIRVGFNEVEAVNRLNLLNDQFIRKRIKRANKDLLIAVVFISIPLVNFLLFYFDIVVIKFGIIEIACLLAFRPFFLSYYRVVKDKNKF